MHLFTFSLLVTLLSAIALARCDPTLSPDGERTHDAPDTTPASTPKDLHGASGMPVQLERLFTHLVLRDIESRLLAISDEHADEDETRSFEPALLRKRAKGGRRYQKPSTGPSIGYNRASDFGLDKHDVHTHTNEVERVPDGRKFHHPTSAGGTKEVWGKKVNKTARHLAKKVGQRKQLEAQKKDFTAFGKDTRQFLNGYPKPGSGFAKIDNKKDPRDPVPDGHIAYHGVLAPTRQERKGAGLSSKGKDHRHPGATRVIIHKEPTAKKWSTEVIYHDPARSPRKPGGSNPFSVASYHDRQIHPSS